MADRSLDELKKLSGPAIRHRELVDLAENHSPTSAEQIARGHGWPRRQHKAVYWLSALKRDFGTEALVAFVSHSSSSHARPAEAGSEHAQQEKKMQTRERLLRSVSRTNNPSTKLRILIRNELFDDAAKLIEELAGNGIALFWADSHDGEVFFDTLDGVDKPGIVSLDDRETVAKVVKHRNRVLLFLAEEEKSPRDSQIYIDFEGMCHVLGWTETRKLEFVRQVLDKMTEKEVMHSGWRCTRSTATIRRHYLPDDDPLAVKVELCILRSQFRGGRLFELRSTALPVPIREHPDDERHELDPIVDRFLELGLTEDEVRTEFLKWIKDHTENCRYQFMLAAAGAKCFGRKDDERYQALRSYLPKMWEELIRDPNGARSLELFEEFGEVGLYRSFSNDEGSAQDFAFFRKELIELLSKGRAALVYQLLVNSYALRNSVGARDVSSSESRSRFQNVSKLVAVLARDAFALAYEQGRYGVAAALGQQFNCFDEAALKEQAEREFDGEYEAVQERFSEVRSEWHSGEVNDDYVKTGPGKEWHDACDEVEAKRAARFEELKTSRPEQIDEALQLAIDLDQSVKLDFMTYMVPSKWRD